VHIFVAEILDLVGEQTLDESEEITWSFSTQSEISEAILRGEFSQALHVASLYRVQQFLRARSDA
jgi:hypothetical protein